MSRLLALDYGKVRTGVAATDEGRIIASGLPTVATSELLDFLDSYLAEEKVGALVVGLPVQMDGSPSESEGDIQQFLRKFVQKYPEMPVHRQDERFTSKMAAQSLRLGGASKKKRHNKGLVDEISAVLILQAFMDKNPF